MTTSPNPYRGLRFPAEIIEHAVWLYHCFSLSLRDVELILAARSVPALRSDSSSRQYSHSDSKLARLYDSRPDDRR